MRVVAGTARGRRLKQPRGTDTRPTTDKVKESLFNIIQFELSGRRALDLFAGTGQLGIEALSRGASHCSFVDVRGTCASLIRENLERAGVSSRARVVQGDALGFLSACREKFDLVFLDPPYQSGLLERALERLTEIDILLEHGIIICETGSEQLLPPLRAPYETGREYRYGSTKLTLCRRQGRERRI